MNFKNLHIILLETTHPGNIGAAARAMKNMGLERLILVRPACFPHAEASARAVGAADILAHARVVNDLDAALTGCHLVIGTSARQRHITSPLLDPRQCAARVAIFSEYMQVAFLFGRERTGLTNEEVDRCNFLVRIPANPAYSSLNLAAAVLVLGYELRMAAEATVASRTETKQSLPAPAEEMARFYHHLEQVLLEIGFLDTTNTPHLIRRLRRLFNRAQPEQRELNILRGILTAAQSRKNWRRH